MYRKLEEIRARQASRLESDFISQETEDVDYLLAHIERLDLWLTNCQRELYEHEG